MNNPIFSSRCMFPFAVAIEVFDISMDATSCLPPRSLRSLIENLLERCRLAVVQWVCMKREDSGFLSVRSTFFIAMVCASNIILTKYPIPSVLSSAST